jgi:protein XagA
VTRMRRTLAVLILMAVVDRAEAGAWTLKRGHWQVFTASTQSTASESFDGKGRAQIPTVFSKRLVQNSFEYGLTGALTLFVTPNYVTARVAAPGRTPIRSNNVSIEAGARLLLDGRHGELALQASYKTAGAFDLSVSANHASGEQIDLRLLYGTSFKLFGHNGFADVQIAQRWIDHPRPNETPIDLTAGLWLTKRAMVMLQSFNIVSAGDARPPYTYYRSHKLELSYVRRLSRHWSLQMGAFYSPAGQNALAERGITISLWTQD